MSVVGTSARCRRDGDCGGFGGEESRVVPTASAFAFQSFLKSAAPTAFEAQLLKVCCLVRKEDVCQSVGEASLQSSATSYSRLAATGLVYVYGLLVLLVASDNTGTLLQASAADAKSGTVGSVTAPGAPAQLSAGPPRPRSELLHSAARLCGGWSAPGAQPDSLVHAVRSRPQHIRPAIVTRTYNIIIRSIWLNISNLACILGGEDSSLLLASGPRLL